jgi:hypothetical protein
MFFPGSLLAVFRYRLCRDFPATAPFKLLDGLAKSLSTVTAMHMNLGTNFRGTLCP